MKKIIFTCIILSVFLLTSVVKGQPPMPPCVFYGSVYIDEKLAPDGVNVTAVVAGVPVNVTQTVNGTYEAVVLSEQAADGETVQFYVAGNIANQVGIFEAGGAVRLDLNATSALHVVIDQSYVSHAEANSGSVQTIGFHAEWSRNGSNVIQGSITVGMIQGYVIGGNQTCSVNATGWITFNATSPDVNETAWAVTAVSCGGVSIFTQTEPAASIIWNRIKITDGGVTQNSTMTGETVTIWFRAVYEFDNSTFNSTEGALYVNASALTWSSTNNRWEYKFNPTTAGTETFLITGALALNGITAINDNTGAKTLTVTDQPLIPAALLYVIVAIAVIIAFSATIFFLDKKGYRLRVQKEPPKKPNRNRRVHNSSFKTSKQHRE